MTEMTPFTDEEREVFDTYFADEGYAMMRVMFMGEPRAVITTVAEDGDDTFMSPIAIIVTGDMFDSMDAGPGVETIRPEDVSQSVDTDTG